jgi:hypothetical protein
MLGGELFLLWTNVKKNLKFFSKLSPRISNGEEYQNRKLIFLSCDGTTRRLKFKTISHIFFSLKDWPAWGI